MPAWISAICAVIAVIVSIVALFKSKKYYSEYALVGKDGTVLSSKGFKNYGLQVVLRQVPIDQNRPNQLVPEYEIMFEKIPDYFEVTNREGGVVRLSQASPTNYILRFVGAGYGSPVIECNFKIQAYQ